MVVAWQRQRGVEAAGQVGVARGETRGRCSEGASFRRMVTRCEGMRE